MAFKGEVTDMTETQSDGHGIRRAWNSSSIILSLCVLKIIDMSIGRVPSWESFMQPLLHWSCNFIAEEHFRRGVMCTARTVGRARK